MQSDEDL